MAYIEAARSLIRRTREKLLRLPSRSRQKMIFLLYHERMLDLIESAVEVRERGGAASSAILIRSALECSVDLINLSQSEHYLLILQAVVLENRYDIFRFKTPALYDSLIDESGGSQAAKMGKDLLEELKSCVKEATKHYPSLQNNPRNLSVIYRFKLANRKDHYYTLYTWISMQSHNDLEPLLLPNGMAGEDEIMRSAQTATQTAAVIHLALELLVDGAKCIHRLFGPDDAFIGDLIAILDRARPEDEKRTVNEEETRGRTRASGSPLFEKSGAKT